MDVDPEKLEKGEEEEEARGGVGVETLEDDEGEGEEEETEEFGTQLETGVGGHDGGDQNEDDEKMNGPTLEGEEQDEEDGQNEGDTEEVESEDAAEKVDGIEDDLEEPFVIDPGFVDEGVGEGVGLRDGMIGEDEAPGGEMGPDVVGEEGVKGEGGNENAEEKDEEKTH